MLRASVLIPTHEHAETLPFAVASVQAQGIDDTEILIVGDGVNDALRVAIERLQADDPRIRFFDFPKGPRHGEIHRDTVLRQAKGRIVFYLADDDLWLPGHLLEMEAALEDADFVAAMQVVVYPDGPVRGYFFDLNRPEFVEPWLAWQPEQIRRLGRWATEAFGLSAGAHRLEAYLRLPEGWATTPREFPTDQFMWHKFVRQPWCRVKSLHQPLTLHFPSTLWRVRTMQQHADELARWSGIIAGSDGAARIVREMFTELCDRLLNATIHDIAELERERLAHCGELERQREAHRNELERQRDSHRNELEQERTAHRAAASQRDAVLESTSWRVTNPLRMAAKALHSGTDRLRRLTGRRGA